MEVKTHDGWENVVTQLGRDRDKRQGGRIKSPSFSTSEDQFSDLYHADDLAGTIAELPAHEMVREWITLNVDDSAGTEGARTEDVSDRMDVAKETLQALDDLDAQTKVFEALVWARVFGAGLLFLGADDGFSSNPELVSEPLRVDKIQSFNFLQVLHRFELEVESVDGDPLSPRFGQPVIYRRNVRTSSRIIANSPIVRIHASRLIRFDGPMTTPRRRDNNSGWNDSIFIRLEEMLRDYGVAWGSVAHLFQDFSQAVFKINGLANALSSDNENLIIARLAILDKCRSVSRAVPLDAQNEDFKREATPVSGLPELLDRFMTRLSGASRIPVSLLFGQSPAGLQATGDSDIRFFYDNIRAKQQSMLRPAVNRLVELLFAAGDGPTRGKEPDNWSIGFKPLWQMTEGEQTELRARQSETDVRYIQTGVLTADEVAQSRFGGDQYSADTMLDTEAREQQAAADDALDEPEPEDLEDGEETAIPADGATTADE